MAKRKPSRSTNKPRRKMQKSAQNPRRSIEQPNDAQMIDVEPNLIAPPVMNAPAGQVIDPLHIAIEAEDAFQELGVVAGRDNVHPPNVPVLDIIEQPNEPPNPVEPQVEPQVWIPPLDISSTGYEDAVQLAAIRSIREMHGYLASWLADGYYGSVAIRQIRQYVEDFWDIPWVQVPMVSSSTDQPGELPANVVFDGFDEQAYEEGDPFMIMIHVDDGEDEENVPPV